MKKIAVCLKPQQLDNSEGYSVWRHFPLGVIGIRTLNYAMSISQDADVELIAFVMAPMKFLEEMQKLYFWGFSKIVFISDTKIAGADSLGTARILSKAISKYCCDIVIAGKSSEDSCTGQVPVQIAMALNANYYYDKNFDLKNILKKGKAVIAVERNYPEIFPDLSTIQSGLNKSVDIISLQELGLNGQKLKYTDVVQIKHIEFDSHENQFIEISPDRAAEIIKKYLR